MSRQDSVVSGLGVDIVEIRRLERVIQRWGELFLKRVFTEKELAYSQSRRFPFQHLAARFAAKEAIFKALGTRPSLNFRDIEIDHDRHGRPQCRIKRTKRLSIKLSMSHSHEYAVASAIVQKKA